MFYASAEIFGTVHHVGVWSGDRPVFTLERVNGEDEVGLEAAWHWAEAVVENLNAALLKRVIEKMTAAVSAAAHEL